VVVARRFTIALACVVVTLSGCGGGSAPSVGLDDIPPELRESQHLLGQIETAMINAPDTPNAMAVPPRHIRRVATNGFWDEKVRVWARSVIRAENKLDAHLIPIHAQVIAKAGRARTLAHSIGSTDLLSLDFLEKYGALATAEHEWIQAELAQVSELRSDMRLLARTVAAYEEFLEAARAGALASTKEEDDAIARFPSRRQPVALPPDCDVAPTRRALGSR